MPEKPRGRGGPSEEGPEDQVINEPDPRLTNFIPGAIRDLGVYGGDRPRSGDELIYAPQPAPPPTPMLGAWDSYKNTPIGKVPGTIPYGRSTDPEKAVRNQQEMMGWNKISYETPPDVPAHDALATARVAGYGWDEIDNHIGQRTEYALASGYSQADVDKHLGYPDPQPLVDRFRQGWERRFSEKPELIGALTETDPTPMLSGDWVRRDYADALLTGQAKNPGDFAQKYVGSYLQASGEAEGPAVQQRAAEATAMLAQTLPSQKDAIDYALAVTADAGGPITPGAVAVAKANLMDHWAETGSPPAKTYDASRTDPELRERMTTPQRLISTILEGTLTAAQFFKGAGEGAAAGFTGDESLRDRAKDMSRAEAGGAALGLLPGLLLSPVYAGAKGLEAAVEQGIVDYDAAAKGAGAVMFLKPGWTPSTAVRVFDPIKAPGEAVREAPLSQALARDDALHDAAQSVVGLPEAAKVEKLTTPMAGANPYPSARELVNSGRTPVYHDTNADALVSILQTGAIEPRVARGVTEPFVFATRDATNFSKRAESPYRLVLDKEEAGRSTPLDVFGERSQGGSEAEEVFANAVPTKAIKSIAVDPENPAFIAELNNGNFQKVLGAAEEAGVKIEYGTPGKAAPTGPDPKAAAELSAGYDATAALIARMNPEFYSGFSLSAARHGLERLWRSPAQMADAAAQAEAKTFAEATIRKFRGMSDRDIAQHFNAIEQYRAGINEHMGEYASWLRMGPMRPTQKPLIADMIDYMEGRSVGATLDPNSPLAPVANALRDINESLRTQIEAYDPNFGNFYQDYYRHLWVDPRKADQAFGVGRQGSGASLQLRSIPTISEGIDRGLMPKILDPIENTMHYAAGMSSHLAAKRVLDESRGAGYVRYGTSPPQSGWVPLEGMASVLPAGENAVQRAYAPPGFASSYNNWVGQGFYRWPTAGKIYNNLQFVANAMTGMKLALSGYHAVNIVKETAIAELTNGIGEISRGELLGGLRDVGYGATILPGLVDYGLKGAAFQRKFLDPMAVDPVVDLLTQAGFNPLSRSRRYTGVASPDIANNHHGATIYQMLSRKSLGWTLAEEAKGIVGSAEEAAGYRTVMAGPRAAGFMVNQIGRVMNALNAPLFDGLIPKVKAGAAASEMEAWLRRNPTAGEEQKLSVARKISDSMDDRFGEMNQDNLFWPRAVKQSLNLATVSVGWEYGTLRAFGGAAKDVLSGELNSTRARWLIAFPVVAALTNAMYQYLMTDQAPQSAKDLILPKTGGKTFDGLAPERALAPGYEKDVLQAYKAFASVPDFVSQPFTVAGNFAKIAHNKLNPFWQAIGQTFSGQDAIGHYIYNKPNPPLQSWGVPPEIGNWLRMMGEQVTPISVENQRLQGTHITDAQRVMGYRPPAMFFMNPENEAAKQIREQHREQRIEARRKAREDARKLP